MYEESEIPVWRRLLWIGLWFVVIVVVLWVLIWLLFFRHTTPSKVVVPGARTSQSQSHPKTPAGSSAKAGAGSGSSGQINAPGQSTTAAGSGASGSGQLANTGAGNVFVPAGLGMVAGSALYYVRLRRRLPRAD